MRVWEYAPVETNRITKNSKWESVVFFIRQYFYNWIEFYTFMSLMCFFYKFYFRAFLFSLLHTEIRQQSGNLPKSKGWNPDCMLQTTRWKYCLKYLFLCKESPGWDSETNNCKLAVKPGSMRLYSLHICTNNLKPNPVTQ